MIALHLIRMWIAVLHLISMRGSHFKVPLTCQKEEIMTNFYRLSTTPIEQQGINDVFSFFLITINQKKKIII
jgi:hypothetical protein